MRHEFVFLKTKTDRNDTVWTVCECVRCGLLRRRTDQSSWDFTRTGYHRRGVTVSEMGNPFWANTLKEIGETTCNGGGTGNTLHGDVIVGTGTQEAR